MHPDLARGVSKNLMPVRQLYPKHSIGQCFFDYAFDLYSVFLSHKRPADQSPPDSLPACSRKRQHLRFAFGDRYRVLEVGGEATISRAHRPAVGILLGLPIASGDHRLQG